MYTHMYTHLQVFPHEYRRALAEADAIQKAEEEQKAAIKAAGEGCQGFFVASPRVQGFRSLSERKTSRAQCVCSGTVVSTSCMRCGLLCLSIRGLANSTQLNGLVGDDLLLDTHTSRASTYANGQP